MQSIYYSIDKYPLKSSINNGEIHSFRIAYLSSKLISVSCVLADVDTFLYVAY